MFVYIDKLANFSLFMYLEISTKYKIYIESGSYTQDKMRFDYMMNRNCDSKPFEKLWYFNKMQNHNREHKIQFRKLLWELCYFSDHIIYVKYFGMNKACNKIVFWNDDAFNKKSELVGFHFILCCYTCKEMISALLYKRFTC